MDFTCSNCGAWNYHPPTESEKQDAIRNLQDLLDGFRAEPWQIDWLEYHEPDLMRRFYEGIDKLLAKD